MCKEEKDQLVLYEIIQLQENGSRNVFVSILTEEAPFYPPLKPMQGFKGFDTIILYVQLSASSKVWWQLDQLSIINPISWKTFILVSNIHGAGMI